jgi:hypothetical protein
MDAETADGPEGLCIRAHPRPSAVNPFRPKNDSVKTNREWTQMDANND